MLAALDLPSREREESFASASLGVVVRLAPPRRWERPRRVLAAPDGRSALPRAGGALSADLIGVGHRFCPPASGRSSRTVCRHGCSAVCPPARGRSALLHSASTITAGLPSRAREELLSDMDSDWATGFALPRAGGALTCKAMTGMANRAKRRSRESKFRRSGFTCIGDDDVKQPRHVARCDGPGPAPHPPKVTGSTCPIRLVPVRLEPRRPHGPP